MLPATSKGVYSGGHLHARPVTNLRFFMRKTGEPTRDTGESLVLLTLPAARELLSVPHACRFTNLRFSMQNTYESMRDTGEFLPRAGGLGVVHSGGHLTAPALHARPFTNLRVSMQKTMLVDSGETGKRSE